MGDEGMWGSRRWVWKGDMGYEEHGYGVWVGERVYISIAAKMLYEYSIACKHRADISRS